jgi:hypothetical protein
LAISPGGTPGPVADVSLKGIPEEVRGIGAVVQLAFTFTPEDPREELQGRVVVGGEGHDADA